MSDWVRTRAKEVDFVRRAPWMIAKCFVDGHTLYVLSSDVNGGTRFGHFETAVEAMQYADQMEAANA